MEDFVESVSEADYRFYALSGITTVVPYVRKHCIDMEEDIRVISGTTEIRVGYEEEKLNAVAMAYASYYNTLMLHHLSKEFDFVCID